MHYGDVILACLHLPLFAYQTLSTCHHVPVQVSSALRKLAIRQQMLLSNKTFDKR